MKMSFWNDKEFYTKIDGEHVHIMFRHDYAEFNTLMVMAHGIDEKSVDGERMVARIEAEDNKCNVKFFESLDDDLAKKIEDTAYKFIEDYFTIIEAMQELKRLRDVKHASIV